MGGIILGPAQYTLQAVPFNIAWSNQWGLEFATRIVRPAVSQRVYSESSFNRESAKASSKKEVIVVHSEKIEYSNGLNTLKAELEEEVDIIDLGAPRGIRSVPPERVSSKPARVASTYTPNPRLYPGPQAKFKKVKRDRATETKPAEPKETQQSKRKRFFRRPVPNARLYRPGPPPPKLISKQARVTWTAVSAGRALDTASRAALGLVEERVGSARSPGRGLVVRLPGGGMETTNRHSTSPEDCSDGNETMSAPSEFLAEFLSAIMRREYAEALKYCKLILQYEPHNATARGFYPLLQNKLDAQQKAEEVERRDSSSESASEARRLRTKHEPEEAMEQDPDGSWSSGRSSASELDLDSSSASASPSRSLTISRHTDSGSGTSAAPSGSSATDTDDNGNIQPPTTAHTYHSSDDVENDNTAAAGEPQHLIKDSSSLRRLRAQFACSIK
ncbi:uncharacterized protein LOC101739641 isoform X3 [Bombyx mori]|uniref:Uncharacterized protein n=1 Tax=Bombyx mori TaxID=7091 RepID=A0A8R2LUQ0_BOMMO|nr:uncharacterized protein LOC101739641 isoform X2 [Bombyx mori]